jgi:hypothetical protein
MFDAEQKEEPATDERCKCEEDGGSKMEAKMVGKEGRTGAADFSGGICYVCSRSNAVPVAAAKVGVAGPPLPSSSISNAAIILRIDLKGLRGRQI